MAEEADMEVTPLRHGSHLSERYGEKSRVWEDSCFTCARNETQCSCCQVVTLPHLNTLSHTLTYTAELQAAEINIKWHVCIRMLLCKWEKVVYNKTCMDKQKM